jgi:Uma2 family endonuclease
MVRRSRSGTTTFAEFMEIVREDQKADLIDGVIYMPSPENIEHNELLLWLANLLHPFIRGKDLGRLTAEKVSYRLSKTDAPEPDLAFVRTERLDIIRRGYVDGPPDLPVEIVSPDSAGRDYEDKRRLYERAGVREYWIIDSDEKTALFLLRTEDGNFVEAPVEGHVFRSSVLPGFHLDVGWLWQRPLPDTLPIVHQLLVGTSSAGV